MSETDSSSSDSRARKDAVLPLKAGSAHVAIWRYWGDRVVVGLALYCLTTVIVLVGVVFGVEYVPRRSHPKGNGAGLPLALANWDGVWYAEIARDDYSYNSDRPSSVAFFPLFPVLGRAVVAVTGWPAEYALVGVSHLSLMGLFILTCDYVRRRYAETTVELSDWVLLALGLWPTTMFFRMAYTESLFLLLLVAVLWAMERGWRPWTIAVIVGLSTACRTTGVALLPVLALYLWQRRSNTTSFLVRSPLVLSLGCWGLVAYMVYQYVEFGDALAFVKTQQHWVTRHPESWGQYLLALVTCEPLWSKYVPSSTAFWARHEHGVNPLFSLEFANPIYFLLSGVLVGIGYWKRWLNGRELLLAAGLLAIPYLTHSYRAVMMGHARYAASVFPAYLVMGQLLWRAAPPVSAVVVAMMAAVLFTYSALFAGWYRFF
ncbi:MAG: hypothetical protein KDA59_07550 [Planctomycetales bacterium]|nr:hypothetical protein [Planctomycetales bacterium]